MLKRLQKTLSQPLIHSPLNKTRLKTPRLTIISDRSISMSFSKEPTAEEVTGLLKKLEQKFLI